MTPFTSSNTPTEGELAEIYRCYLAANPHKTCMPGVDKGKEKKKGGEKRNSARLAPLCSLPQYLPLLNGERKRGGKKKKKKKKKEGGEDLPSEQGELSFFFSSFPRERKKRKEKKEGKLQRRAADVVYINLSSLSATAWKKGEKKKKKGKGRKDQRETRRKGFLLHRDSTEKKEREEKKKKDPRSPPTLESARPPRSVSSFLSSYHVVDFRLVDDQRRGKKKKKRKRAESSSPELNHHQISHAEHLFVALIPSSEGKKRKGERKGMGERSERARPARTYLFFFSKSMQYSEKGGRGRGKKCSRGSRPRLCLAGEPQDQLSLPYAYFRFAHRSRL